jgi:CheY-like chemotaxis protein
MSPKLRFEVVSMVEVARDSMDFGVEMPTVLVVDDERVIADSLSMILRSKGLKVLTAYDGESALAMATSVAPDLLITDVSMPAMNGVELAMSLLETTPDCKVLLFSGNATLADLLPAQQAGYDFPLLTKPVPPFEMLGRVSELLGVPIELGFARSLGSKPAPGFGNPNPAERRA